MSSNANGEMPKVDPERAAQLAKNLTQVLGTVKTSNIAQGSVSEEYFMKQFPVA